MPKSTKQKATTMKKIKIGKNLRNLLMRDEHTLMTSRKSAIYMGEQYTFEPITQAERLEYTMNLLKRMDRSSWKKLILDWINK